MLLLPASSIQISPDRQRQEFSPEALADLTNSIQAIGLLHPVVVRQSVDDPDTVILVAGERRMRAIISIYEMFDIPIRCAGQYIPINQIPCLSLGDLSPLEAEEAELDENIKRANLSWQEHAAALDRLHQFRIRQVAAAAAADTLAGTTGTFADMPKRTHTVADTANEVLGRADGGYGAAIRKELLVARHLDNPEVAKAKTVEDAYKVLRNQEDRKKNEALAATVGASLSSKSHTLLHGDSLVLLASADFDGKFDVICSDPMYGMDAHKFGDAAGRMTNIQHHYEDTYEAWLAFMRAFLPRSMGITKSQAHMYLFCDLDRFHELKRLCEEVGWYVFRTPLVYVKTGGGRVPLPEMGPRRCYELALYAVKGKKPVTHIYPDVIQAAADVNESHGAQKSVAVFQNLLQRSVGPGDQVLDPCAGTGTMALAAHALKCYATCIEQQAEYYGIACKRVQGLG